VLIDCGVHIVRQTVTYKTESERGLLGAFIRLATGNAKNAEVF
jgi:hypothetical protein